MVCTHSSGLVFEPTTVTCTGSYYNNFGAVVDALIIENAGVTKPIKLILLHLIFHNQSIMRGWYNGLLNITHLVIDGCQFKRIEKKAFKTDAFNILTSIYFTNLNSIDCDKDMLNGLPLLGSVFFQNTTFKKLDQPFLLPTRALLTEFVFIGSDVLNFDDLFGSFRLFRLKIVQFFNVMSLTTLTNSNFTGLSAIQKLEISTCGVKVIAADAFEYILETLVLLNLSNNKIKTLHATTFNALIQRNMVMRTLSMLRFRGNNLICDCNLFEASNMLILGFDERSIHYYTFLTACLDQFIPDPDLKLPQQLTCDNLQKIHGKKLCLKLDEIQYQVHPRFQLKLDKNYENVLVLSRNERQFRMWIQQNGNLIPIDEKRSRCPKLHWVMSYVECKQYADDTISKIPIRQIMNSRDVTMICLNYLLHRGEVRFWPLNCISTIDQNSAIDLSVWMEIWISNSPIICVCIIAGLIVGTLLIIIHQIVSLWTNKYLQTANR